MEIIVTATYVEKTLQSLTSLFMVWHRPHFEEGINKIALLENFNFECLLSSLANKAENMVKLKDKKIHEIPILQLKDLPPTYHHQTLIMAKRILTIILINIEITTVSHNLTLILVTKLFLMDCHLTAAFTSMLFYILTTAK